VEAGDVEGLDGVARLSGSQNPCDLATLNSDIDQLPVGAGKKNRAAADQEIVSHR